MNKSLQSILSRAISIVSKFLLLTFLAKILSLSDYGAYQLITYFTMIAISIYGVEYYMYGNREIAKGDNSITKINNHISFFITLFPLTFLLQIIALFFLVPTEILSVQVFVIIVFVNFCDYFNQEVYRYLIMVKKISQANLLLIAKSSIFLVLIVSCYLINETIDLDITLRIMFVSFIILLIITSLFLFKYIIRFKDINFKILNRKELKKTMSFLFPFVILMFFTKGLEFFDKFAIEYFYDTKHVGVYSFLFSIASLIHVFVVSGFYLVFLPELIGLNEERNKKIKKELVRFSALVLSSSLILSIVIIIFIDILLEIIGKADLIENINILYILLSAFFFLNLSLIPGIILYIKGKDRLLMYISGIVLIVNVTFNLIFLKLFNLEGAAIALSITHFINFIIMSYKANTIWKKMKRNFL